MSFSAIGNLKLWYYFGSELECGIDYSDLLFSTRNSATPSAADWPMVCRSVGVAPALEMMDERKKSPNRCLDV